MSRYLSTPLFFVVAALLPFLFLGCEPSETTSKRLISVSIAPEKFFVARIAGPSFEINVLVPPGANPEVYDPTPREIAALSRSSHYFYMGSLGFEQVWLRAIQEHNDSLRCVDLSEYLPPALLCEEHHHHDHSEGCDHSHGSGDPHFWTSVVGARAIAKGVYESLLKAFPDESDQMRERYESLLREISSLEEAAREILGARKHEAFVIYHPSLSYFADEWGLRQLVIEQEGKDPTPLHLEKLLSQAREAGVRVVFVQEEFDTKNALSLAQALGAKIYPIRPLGEDWLTEMYDLLEAFK